MSETHKKVVMYLWKGISIFLAAVWLWVWKIEVSHGVDQIKEGNIVSGVVLLIAHAVSLIPFLMLVWWVILVGGDHEFAKELIQRQPPPLDGWLMKLYKMGGGG